MLKLFSDVKEAVIGVVLSPHGVGGMVKVFPYSDFPERIKELDLVGLQKDSWKKEMLIEQASLYGRFWLIKFRGIDNREDAAALREGLLTIPIENRVSLPDDSYYHDQLIGLMVVDSVEKPIGIIVDLLSTGGHDLLIMEDNLDKKRIMIPAVKRFVRQVDCASGKIIVDLPEGLLDL